MNKHFLFQIKYQRLFLFLFSFLILDLIIDPSNQLFHLKEILFSFTILTGLFDFIKFGNYKLFFLSILISIIIPLISLLIGLSSNFNFLLEVGLSYFKSFVLFLLVNMLLSYTNDYGKIFSKLTLVLVPISLVIFYLLVTSNFSFLKNIMGDYKDTVKIANRSFGSFDLIMVYYKTVSLLIFGLSYLCSKKRFKFLGLNFLMIALCAVVLILSSTRANILSVFIIVIIYSFRNFFSKKKILKVFFWCFSVFLVIIEVMPFLMEYFFNKDEASNKTKLGFINDYVIFWSDNTLAFFIGQGLGSGIYTIERNLVYTLETTYFEIIRIFGLIGGLFFVLFMLTPLILFHLSKNTKAHEENSYFLLGYIIYIFVIIPTNPLFLSSTGILVMLIAYSVSIKVFLLRNNR
jgi:hypothetical protein